MVYIAQQSFGFGEIDPNLRSQYESQPYQKGCRVLSNALLSDTGSAQKRWGSVFHTDSPGNDKAFEFINGYGDTFLILGSSTGYSILKGDTVLATYTSTDELLKDAASTGNELILLTYNGIYRHVFTKKPDNSYLIQRFKMEDIAANLLTSLPPVTFTSDTTTPSTITTSDIWWNANDNASEPDLPIPSIFVGHADEYTNYSLKSDEIWKVSQAKTPGTSLVPRFQFVKSVESNTVVDVSDYYRRTNHLKHGATPGIDDGTVSLQTGDWTVYSSSQTRLIMNFNGADSLTFTPSISDGDEVAAERKSDTEIRIYQKDGSAYSSSGTQDSRYSFDWIGIGSYHPPDATFYNSFDESFREVTGGGVADDAGATEDWAGPYKNWVQVGKALQTDGGTVTGMIEGATWSALAIGSVATLDSGISGDWDADHKKAISAGQVGRFLHYTDGMLYRTTYFYVVDKEMIDPDSTGLAYICPIQGNALEAPRSDGNSAVGDVLILQLASSEVPDDSVSAAKMSDGRPASKKGWFPEMLIRQAETSGGETVDRVGMVGCPAESSDITSYVPTFSPGALVSTTTSFTNTVRHTRIVGDLNPVAGSDVFRVGKSEIDDKENFPSTTTGGLGATAYWKLTGRSISPIPAKDHNATILVIPERIEYHQGRIFISGFNADISTSNSGLRWLSASQNLGLTVIASQSGSTTNFDPGDSSANDGISFQISSKKGGMIRWMKSQFNALFLGSDEEEFVIADAPMTPASVNISMQSEYGGKEGACAVSFGSAIVFVQADGKTIRSMGFQERRNRYESEDLLQFAKHITDNDTIKRIEVVGTATQRLFALTDGGKLYCFTKFPQNAVYGWNEWSNSQYTTIADIVGTTDDSGNPALWARTSFPDSIFITSDGSRSDYHVDGAIDYTTGITTSGVTVSSDFNGKTVSAIVTDSSGNIVYVGDAAVSGATFTFGTAISPAPSKVVVGYPYTMTIAPNIPELMVPGKGSTLGRDKNISRLRILFNMARGATASGYELLQVPDPDGNTTVVADSPGFYSVPVVGAYGPQPTINITQSAPYGFEVSGYNAEYDFGD